MTEQPDVAPEAPEGVDTEKPAAARVYDWYLGGNHNWAVDREFGKKVEQLFPFMKDLARQNRAFLGRVVRAALDAGIRQFLDLGSGVPTAGNVHEVVREHLPGAEQAKVVYVDYEPVAAAHATLLLERQDALSWAGFVQEDLRQPSKVLRHDTTRRLIDFEQPVCVLMVAVLHFVGPDDRPAEVIARYRDVLAPGSWLVLSHTTTETASTAEDIETSRLIVSAYQNTSNPAWPRNRSEVEDWFGGWPLVEPGFVHPPDWRPDRELKPSEARARPFNWCAAAEKPLLA